MDCNNPNISLSELLNSALCKVTADGTVGLRTKTITVAESGIEDYIACANVPISDTEVIRLAFGLTDSGKTCLILIEEA